MAFAILRPVRPSDLPRLLEIYTPYVRDSAVTFEYEVPSLAEFTARVDEISSQYPYLVCEQDGFVAGYAYAHRHMVRAAYQWNAELSIYLDETFQGRGLGSRLYASLLETLEQMNVRNVYGCVTLPNPKSGRLHEKLGFRLAGIWPHSGYKLGMWHDVGWFEKSLGPGVGRSPAPFRPIGSLPVGPAVPVFNTRSC